MSKKPTILSEFNDNLTQARDHNKFLTSLLEDIHTPSDNAISVAANDTLPSTDAEFYTLPPAGQLQYLKQQHADILYSTIDIQKQIAHLGKQRIDTLKKERNRLTQEFNSPQLRDAFDKDIDQQCQDIATMFVMSHSALAILQHDLSQDHDDRYLQAKRDVDDLFHFQREVLQQDRPIKFASLAGPVEEFLNSSAPLKTISAELEQLAALNLQLINNTGKRLENSILTLNLRQNMMADKAVLTDQTSHTNIRSLAPESTNDNQARWAYDLDSQYLYTMRSQILSDRVESYLKYADLLGDLDANHASIIDGQSTQIDDSAPHLPKLIR